MEFQCTWVKFIIKYLCLLFYYISAPELLLEKPYLGLKSEMYALGVLLYFMLFGKPPYIYPNLFNPDDVELANVIK